MKRGILLATLAAIALVVGCDRRVEPFVPRELEPPPSERPVRVPGLETPLPRAAAPLADASVNQTVRGTIELQDGLTPPRGAVLFLIARSPAGGPPLAVKRLPVDRFPLEFEIGPDDAMLRGRPLGDELLLSARIDADGDAMTRDAQDPQAALPAPVSMGSSGIRLLLERPH